VTPWTWCGPRVGRSTTWRESWGCATRPCATGFVPADPQRRKPPADAGDAGASLNVAEKDAEIARLRAQVAELQTEKEILRKAAAFFAKEMDR
jgi:hypothetical protein